MLVWACGLADVVGGSGNSRAGIGGSHLLLGLRVAEHADDLVSLGQVKSVAHTEAVVAVLA